MDSQRENVSKVDTHEIKKKKGDKTIDILKRNIIDMNTPDEKIDYICQKYSELYQDLKKNKSLNQNSEKQLANIQKEKDHLTKEYNKVLLQKGNLENLSRELQKQKQKVQDESIIRTRLEEEKRKEISNLFKTKITEIESQMITYQENNEKLRSENQDLATKLSKFLEQYELKEQHNTKMLQTKQLEFQLAEAKLKQSQCILEEFSSKFKQEKEQTDKQIDDQRTRLKMHEQIEEKLKEQIEFYRSKYEDFQKTLNDSNQIFVTCKKEMEKMANNIKRLEKENMQLKQKWENTNCSALTLASEKAKSDEQINLYKIKLEKLESLCRALQIERSNLQKSLEETKKSEGSDKESSNKQLEKEVVETVQSDPVDQSIQ